MTPMNGKVSRRAFLSNAAFVGVSGALGAGSVLTSCSGSGKDESKYVPLRPLSEVYIPELPDKAINGKPLKAALIGCGGRGTGAAFNFLDAGEGLSIVSCADMFKDRMDLCRKNLKERKNLEIDDANCHLGFDAYQKAIDTPGVDLVLVCSPGLFHPDHLQYAIERGKHVFCEKPAAIDPAGYRKYMVAVRQAKANNLCLVTGTHLRHHRGYVEAYRKIQEGYIGRIVAGNVYWCQAHSHFMLKRPEWTDIEYMLRSQFCWIWTSGSILVDQLLHNVDVFTWFSHLKPVRAMGTGSCQRRMNGDVYDVYSVDIEYEGGVHLHGIERQIDGCDNITGEYIQGTKGTFDNLNGKFTILDHDGNELWKYDQEAAEAQFKEHNAYLLEHVNFVNHLRQGKTINMGEATAMSSMACIMAREAAYTGKIYTWDQMIQSELNFMPTELTLRNVDMSKYTVPVQGKAPNV